MFSCFAPSKASPKDKHKDLTVLELKKTEELEAQLHDVQEKHKMAQKQALAELEKAMQGMQLLEKQRAELDKLRRQEKENQEALTIQIDKYAELELNYLEVTSRLQELEASTSIGEDQEVVEKLASMASTQAQVQKRLASIVSTQEQERGQYQAEIANLKEHHKAEIAELASALDVATMTADTAVQKYESAVQKYTKLQSTEAELTDELERVRKERDNLSNQLKQAQSENADMIGRLGEEAPVASSFVMQLVSHVSHQ